LNYIVGHYLPACLRWCYVWATIEDTCKRQICWNVGQPAVHELSNFYHCFVAPKQQFNFHWVNGLCHPACWMHCARFSQWYNYVYRNLL